MCYWPQKGGDHCSRDYLKSSQHKHSHGLALFNIASRRSNYISGNCSKSSVEHHCPQIHTIYRMNGTREANKKQNDLLYIRFLFPGFIKSLFSGFFKAFFSFMQMCKTGGFEGAPSLNMW